MAKNFNSSSTNQPPQDIMQLFEVVTGATERYGLLVDEMNNTAFWTPQVTGVPRETPLWDVNAEGRNTPIRVPTPGYSKFPLWKETARILAKFMSPRTFDWEAMDLSPAEKEQLGIIEGLLLESRAMRILWTQMNPIWSSRTWSTEPINSNIWKTKKDPKSAPESPPLMATPLDQSLSQFFGCEPANQQTGMPIDVEPVMKIVVKNMLGMRAVLTPAVIDNEDINGAGDGHQVADRRLSAEDHTIDRNGPGVDRDVDDQAIDGSALSNYSVSEHGSGIGAADQKLAAENQVEGEDRDLGIAEQVNDQDMEVDDTSALINQDSEPIVVEQSSAQTTDAPTEQASDAPGVRGQVDHSSSSEGLGPANDKAIVNNDLEHLIVLYNNFVHKNQRPEDSGDDYRENQKLSDAVALTSAPEIAEKREYGNKNVEVVGKALAVVDQNLGPSFEDVAFEDEVLEPVSPNSGSSGQRSERVTQNVEDSLEDLGLHDQNGNDLVLVDESDKEDIGDTLSIKEIDEYELVSPERSLSTSSQGSSGQLRFDLSRADPIKNQVKQFKRARDRALQTKKQIPTDSPDYQEKLEQFNRHCEGAEVFKEEKLIDLMGYLRTYMLVPNEPDQPFPRIKVIYPPTPQMLWREWNEKNKIVPNERFKEIAREDPQFEMWFDLVGKIQKEVVRQIQEGLITGQTRRGMRTVPVALGAMEAPTLSPMASSSQKRAAPRDNEQATAPKQMLFSTTTRQFVKNNACRRAPEMVLPGQGTSTAWRASDPHLFSEFGKIFPELVPGVINCVPQIQKLPIGNPSVQGVLPISSSCAVTASRSNTGPSAHN